MYGFAAGDPVNYSDPFGLDVVFRGEEARWLFQRLKAQARVMSRDKEDKKTAAAGRKLMRMIRYLEQMDEVLVIDTYKGNRTGTAWGFLGVNINADEYPNTQPTVLLAHELGHAYHGLTTGDVMPGHLSPWSAHTRASVGFENAARRYYGCSGNQPYWVIPDWFKTPACR